MEKVALDRLTLLDLSGNPIKLSECYRHFALLIFLRHLA